MLTFVIAHADVVPTWLDAHPGKETSLSNVITPFKELGVANQRYHSFPEWTDLDVQVVGMFFERLMDFARDNLPP